MPVSNSTPADNSYYVYQLIDPRDGAVFYVGKGQGNRVSQHVRDAISGRICNQAKHDLILNIIDAGYLPIENIVAQFSEEDEALHCEAALIADYGVNNLTNILESGNRSFNSLRYVIETAKAIKDRATHDIATSSNKGITEFQRGFLEIADLLTQKAVALKEARCH